MDDNIQDVNIGETTSDTSSSVEEIAPDTLETSAGEQSNTPEVEGGESKRSIPYDRFQEKVAEANRLKEEMAQLRAKAEVADRLGQALNPVDPQDAYRQQQLEMARQELEALGYAPLEKVDQLIEQKLNAYKWQERFVSQMDTLSKTYDGKDGGPKFVAEEVAKYMDDQASRGNIITDPELAFKLMNLDSIAESKAKKQRSSTFSEKPGGPVHEETDKRKSDLAAAAKTGDMRGFLKKYISIPE
jgi:hypothetical protein